MQGVDCSKDKKAVQKLRKEAERVKRSLSTSHQETIEVDAFCGGSDLRETLSRAKFEELNVDLFKKTLAPVQKVATCDVEIAPLFLVLARSQFAFAMLTHATRFLTTAA